MNASSLASVFAVTLAATCLVGCGPTTVAAAIIASQEKKSSSKKKTSSASRTAKLSWSPPTHRVNGEPLGSDLAGYKVYRGTASRTYDTVVDINDPLMTTTEFTTLPPGRYYFAVSAYDQNGLESGYSNEADKLIIE